MKKIKNMKKTSRENGFIALISVSFFSMFFVLLFLGMFFSSTEATRRSLDRERAAKGLSLTNSCAEIAMNNISKDVEYPGEDIVFFDDGSFCEIKRVEYYGKEGRVVKTQAEVESQYKKIQIELSIDEWPSLRIVSWREVSEFSDFEDIEE